MSEDEKEYASRRRQQTQNKIDRQLEIARFRGYLGQKRLDQPHRLAKLKAADCGNPKCVMCMNPRKAWGDKTQQELSFEQTEKWDEL
jgi:hypothetical protein